MGIFKYYDIGHAEVFVFDDFLIKQVKEGVIIDLKETDALKEVLEENFKGRNVAYISNRMTSYSVNPLVYKEIENISNLVAIAIIPNNHLKKSNAEYEKQFFKKPFGVFDSLDEAIKWVHHIISKENSEIPV
ncbi:hypothetical protein [Winogradskyella sp. SYSU M77433]|uniref:hypothetical protein n=1 Tax=Winogradskyella sp. SYSU M77433 TaxID=3042722 RepID=UPI0024804E82|nr:hypothetical protein [Winogradskyella sp. SYSU M77433]MDH7914008.1 hypothetical protein [Winogradskyella sp. SYSU M77433]